MDDKLCQISVVSMPESVRCGQSVDIEVEVQLVRPGATLGFVMLSIPATGETLRFAKKSSDQYVLSYYVPDFAPAGTYEVGVFATDDSGECSKAQRYNIRLL